MNDTYIYDGLNEVMTELELRLGTTVDVVRIINDYTHDYFLNELDRNKAVFVFINLMASPFETPSENSRYAIIERPTLSIQVYSVIKQKNDVNMKLATQIATRIKKYLNGFKTTNFGVLTLPDGNNTPMAVYSDEANQIGWGIEFGIVGKVKYNTNDLTITTED